MRSGASRGCHPGLDGSRRRNGRLASGRPVRYLVAMASCPHCKAPVAWDAVECAACHANFEAYDGWQPKPRDAQEARLLEKRARLQRSRIPAPALGDTSFGLKFALSLILLLVALVVLSGGAPSSDRFWRMATAL